MVEFHKFEDTSSELISAFTPFIRIRIYIYIITGEAERWIKAALNGARKRDVAGRGGTGEEKGEES